MARRSVLFSPGDQPDKLRTAVTAGADVAVFDLEDGVAPDRTADARETVADALADLADGSLEADCEVWVRVNPVGDGARADLATVLRTGVPDCLVLPKAGGPDDVAALVSAARDAAPNSTAPASPAPAPAPVPVVPVVESAAGVLAADRVAAVGATDALVFGAEDLAGDVGAERSPAGEEVLYARQRVLIAARAAGVDAIDTHVPAYDDEERLRADAERARGLGYDGKLAVHPAQVPVIHEAFAPDAERVAWARRVLDAWEAAPDAGVVVVDDEMVDAPQVRQARRILDRAGQPVDR